MWLFLGIASAVLFGLVVGAFLGAWLERERSENELLWLDDAPDDDTPTAELREHDQ